MLRNQRFDYLTKQNWGAVTAITAVAALGYGIYSGEEGRSAQKVGQRRQIQAQQEAKASALSQQRKAEQSQREANKKAPDFSSLLDFEQQPGGFSSAMLTGGIDRSRLRLGRPTLLGDI